MLERERGVRVSVTTKPEVETGGFVIEEVENPTFRINEIFHGFEEFSSPRIWELRERYGLDEVLADETDEFRRQLLLRNWLKQNLIINDRHPTPTRGDAFGILDGMLKGGGFHCAHCMVVQHAVMNAFGYVCRSLGAGPGEKDEGGHHGINEVWSNTFVKWFLSDAKYDIHFEKDGVPLSALDIRDEFHKNEAADIVKVRGPEREPVADMTKDGCPSTYNWVSWSLNTSYFTTYPSSRSSALVVYEDDFCRDNTWYRDGKPNWAYKANYFLPISHRRWIEWTPNVVAVSVDIKPGPSNTDEPGYWAHCTVRSCTPNFKEYQLKVGEGDWHPVEEKFAVPLYKDTNEFRVRSVSLFDVTGPEHLVRVSRSGEAK